MDCQVALAIMPRGGTLEDVRRRQALAKAEVILHEKTKDNKRPPKPVDLERRKQQLVTQAPARQPSAAVAVKGTRTFTNMKVRVPFK